MLHGAAHALLALAPDGFELDPARDDVDGAEGAEVKPQRAAAAVGDQVNLQEAGLDIVPVGEGPDRDLVLEPGARPRRGGSPRGVAAPRRREQPPQRRGTGLAQELVDGRGRQEFAEHGEAIEQLGDEGLQAMGPDASGRLPQHLGRGGHVRAIVARTPGVPGPARGRRPAPQQADRRLAMDPRDGDDLVQDRALLGAGGGLRIPFTLSDGVLAKTGSGHGRLLGGLGNRDF